MAIAEAKQALDKIITKGRVHLYKPIQIAEILYRDRTEKDIELNSLETYRTVSRKWRDVVCIRFLGRTSTSSARYQDDLFNDNAVPPELIHTLGEENRNKNGIVEAYIYRKFEDRFSQMSTALEYCKSHDNTSFNLSEFISLFWNEPGLRRSIDKIYEIIVYSLFSTLVDALEITIELSIKDDKNGLLSEFEDFTKKVLQIDSSKKSIKIPAQINRVGVTNAADRGLDMYANFGPAIQIKHLALTEELAEEIVSSVQTDRIVIVCKDSEEKIIVSLLNQLGWKSKIQSIITEAELINWYDKALTGQHSALLSSPLLNYLVNEIKVEFPATDNKDFEEFINDRGYSDLKDDYWS